MIKSLSPALLATGLLLAGAAAQQPVATHDPGPSYRVVVSMVEKDSQGKTTDREYEMILGPNFGSNDSIRAGGRVPVRTTDANGRESITYQNTGLSIDCSIENVPETPPDSVNINLSVDITTVAPNSTPGVPIFRNVATHGRFRATLGKSEQVANFSDPDSDATYVLMARVERIGATVTAAAAH